MDASLSQDMLQRLLTRLDHIEFRVLREQQQQSQSSQDELLALRSVIDDMQHARQLEAQDLLVANAQAQAPRAVPPSAPASMSHRGPGVLPAPVQPQASVGSPVASPEQGAVPGNAQGDTVLTASPATGPSPNATEGERARAQGESHQRWV